MQALVWRVALPEKHTAPHTHGRHCREECHSRLAVAACHRSLLNHLCYTCVFGSHLCAEKYLAGMGSFFSAMIAPPREVPQGQWRACDVTQRIGPPCSNRAVLCHAVHAKAMRLPAVPGGATSEGDVQVRGCGAAAALLPLCHRTLLLPLSWSASGTFRRRAPRGPPCCS